MAVEYNDLAYEELKRELDNYPLSSEERDAIIREWLKHNEVKRS